MPNAESPGSTAVRIADAQLAGLSRARRVVRAGPFAGLLAVGAPDYLSYAVATHPGDPVADAVAVAESVEVLRGVFPPGGLRFELITQACPGAVELLVVAGFEISASVPLLVLDPAEAVVPRQPSHGVELVHVRAEADLVAGAEVAAAAFGMPGAAPAGPAPEPVDGGSVLARIAGEPVAVASWTQVADGVTEIVGVATAEAHRGRGLGALVTAHAVRLAAELGGATLTWLTPGDPTADRVYCRVGFTPVANAVHLAERQV
ncbi:GNAT family N-acetyltransferase [Actinokineospora auranticolor]|uniref:Acetyltransferase (GNAT) family protein n=1 Tax=Actinokineospora auranticolor TaxID=155976 RepID=A0A2S6GB88_9PSEU|nr:GNAT family N-acetyltransferase [Actinokineospora auranticolor]PPK60823.1 acetyltransferase (GNAT) family protein [Actinokineospora auranticolor]